MNNFNTPILFLIFNRPDTAEKVFAKIREIKPAKLFVSGDGPRAHKAGEKEKCEETRRIIKNIDWDCEIHTNFSETNQGCKRGVTAGINWFFENVEQGIILEDDCTPDLSFFTFCDELLRRYKNNTQIMHIGGTNFQDGIKRSDASYYFSRLCHVWGWATWRRAWKLYDVSIPDFNPETYDADLKNIIINTDLRNHYKNFFQTVKDNKLDTWDFQWVYTVWKNNGLSIIPNVNLVENIGFGEEATHTTSYDATLSNIKTVSLKNIIHPEEIIPDTEADNYTYKKKIKKSKISKAVSKIKNIFK